MGKQGPTLNSLARDASHRNPPDLQERPTSKDMGRLLWFQFP